MVHYLTITHTYIYMISQTKLQKDCAVTAVQITKTHNNGSINLQKNLMWWLISAAGNVQSNAEKGLMQRRCGQLAVGDIQNH